MRATAWLMLAVFLHISSNAVSQQVTLAVKKASLKSVFREISKQTSIYILYDESMLVNTVPVTIDVKNVPLKQVLALCMKDQPLTYSIEERFIVIMPKEKSSSSPGKGLLLTLPGLVVDAEGIPISGVSVAVSGSTQGIITGEDGRFVLHDVPLNVKVVISRLGYEKQEIMTGAQTESRTIILQPHVASLDEIQVIGYGTTTRRYTTGDVSTVSGTDIQHQPVENVLASIADRVPGLLITQSTGIPGGEYSVQIRGRNSISNGNAPLYVIDGVPFTATNPYVSFGDAYGSAIRSAAGYSNPLNMINPADIERIDVLKDADVTAIYGSRGANGVILITTKKGVAGKTKVNASFYTGIGMNPEKMSLMNTPQYLTMRKEALKNDGIETPGPTDYDLNGDWGDSTRYTDWTELLVKGTANIWDGQLSVSGGNANTHFLMSGGYHKERTIFPGDAGVQRVSGHFNLDHTSGNQKFKTALSVGLSVGKSDLPYVSPYGYTNIAPNMPALTNTDGSLNWPAGIDQHPYALLQQQFLSNTNNLITRLTASYQVTKALKLSANMGYTTMWDNTSVLQPLTSINPLYQPTSGYTYFGNSSIRTWIAEPQATYERQLGVGQFNALVGGTFQETRNEASSLMATGFSADNQLANISAAKSIIPFKAHDALYRYMGVFSRINYQLQEQYIFNLTGRRDGSSRFGPGQQFADFWAAGAAWIFSKQAAVANALPFLSFGKLHASYGLTGNDQIGDYRYLSLYQPGIYSYQGIPGVWPGNLANPDYGWETNRKLEIGLVLGVLKDRVLFTANWYQHRSSNQLLFAALPPTTGFPGVQTNLPAIVQNSGWEFTLNTTNIARKDFKWNTSFNLSINKNKLLKYPGLAASMDAEYYLIGKPLSVERLFHSNGVDPVTGEYQFTDKDGKPTVTPSVYDLTAYADLVPAWFGGMQSNITYKGWRLDMSWQIRKQMGYNPIYNSRYANPGLFGINQPVAALDRWQKAGDIATYPQYSQTYSGFSSRQDAMASDLAYTDASYIRLKNLSVGWEFPQQWLTGMHLVSGRIYMQGQNLLTITGYKGVDPETQGVAVPPLKIITLGIQCTL